MNKTSSLIVAAVAVLLMALYATSRPSGRSSYSAPAPTATSPYVEPTPVTLDETPAEASPTEPAPILTISNLGYSRTDFDYDSTTYSWRADIGNTSTDSVEAVCTLRLFDWDGVEMGSAQAGVTLAPGETYSLREKTNIPNYLWAKITRAEMSCDVR